MGYSARYHAASLAAVFLALAIGILIGVGFGDDLIQGTAEDLEQSLESDLTDVRQEAADLEGELARERETAELLYPVVVDDRLAAQRVAIVALGALPPELPADVEEALEPTGAVLSEVAVVGVPPDVDEAVAALPGARAEALPRGEAFDLAARRTGLALAEGGPRFEEHRAALLSSYSGQPEATDAVVLVRQLPPEIEGREAEETERLEEGIVEGLRRAGVTMIGAERSDADPSSIGAFNEHELSSVDSVDLLAGRVALVLALDGAEGVYGTKETADRLLPELVPTGAP